MGEYLGRHTPHYCRCPRCEAVLRADRERTMQQIADEYDARKSTRTPRGPTMPETTIPKGFIAVTQVHGGQKIRRVNPRFISSYVSAQHGTDTLISVGSGDDCAFWVSETTEQIDAMISAALTGAYDA